MLTYRFRNAQRLWLPPGARGVFGGCVIAQALQAAQKTVPSIFKVHSLHSYFVLPGDSTLPILYHVEQVRDGRSYATRTVQATQRDKCIFTITCSFQKPEQSPLQHTTDIIPKLPPAESLPDDIAIAKSLVLKGTLSEDQMDTWIQHVRANPIEHRRIDAQDQEMLSPDQRRQLIYMRAKGKISEDSFHAVALACMSDSSFVMTAVLVNNVPRDEVVMMASLDHSSRFHNHSTILTNSVLSRRF